MSLIKDFNQKELSKILKLITKKLKNEINDIFGGLHNKTILNKLQAFKDGDREDEFALFNDKNTARMLNYFYLKDILAKLETTKLDKTALEDLNYCLGGELIEAKAKSIKNDYLEGIDYLLKRNKEEVDTNFLTETIEQGFDTLINLIKDLTLMQEDWEGISYIYENALNDETWQIGDLVPAKTIELRFNDYKSLRLSKSRTINCFSTYEVMLKELLKLTNIKKDWINLTYIDLVNKMEQSAKAFCLQGKKDDEQPILDLKFSDYPLNWEKEQGTEFATWFNQQEKLNTKAEQDAKEIWKQELKQSK